MWVTKRSIHCTKGQAISYWPSEIVLVPKSRPTEIAASNYNAARALVRFGNWTTLRLQLSTSLTQYFFIVQWWQGLKSGHELVHPQGGSLTATHPPLPSISANFLDVISHVTKIRLTRTNISGFTRIKCMAHSKSLIVFHDRNEHCTC
jgi:hypothetical protein